MNNRGKFREQILEYIQEQKESKNKYWKAETL